MIIPGLCSNSGPAEGSGLSEQPLLISPLELEGFLLMVPERRFFIKVSVPGTQNNGL